MDNREMLIERGLIPVSKYWALRLGFLDIINGTDFYISLLRGRGGLS